MQSPSGPKVYPKSELNIFRGTPEPSTVDVMELRETYESIEADFEPFNDATNYYVEQDCADAFDDEGLSAWY